VSPSCSKAYCHIASVVSIPGVIGGPDATAFFSFPTSSSRSTSWCVRGCYLCVEGASAVCSAAGWCGALGGRSASASPPRRPSSRCRPCPAALAPRTSGQDPSGPAAARTSEAALRAESSRPACLRHEAAGQSSGVVLARGSGAGLPDTLAVPAQGKSAAWAATMAMAQGAGPVT